MRIVIYDDHGVPLDRYLTGREGYLTAMDMYPIALMLKRYFYYPKVNP